MDGGIDSAADVPLFITYSVVSPDSEQIALLPQGTILPVAADQCPIGWERHSDRESGEELFFPFGVHFDAQGNVYTPGNADQALLPACVKTW